MVQTKHIKNWRINDSEIYHKILKRILCSLQIIMIYFKKETYVEGIYNLNIGKFIQRKKVLNIPKQHFEEPLKSAPLFNLVDLYEIIEDQSYEKVELMLDLVYQQPLEEIQKREVLQLVERMNKGDTKRQLPLTSILKRQSKRLIGRILVCLQGDEKSSLCRLPMQLIILLAKMDKTCIWRPLFRIIEDHAKPNI